MLDVYVPFKRRASQELGYSGRQRGRTERSAHRNKKHGGSGHNIEQQKFNVNTWEKGAAVPREEAVFQAKKRRWGKPISQAALTTR